MPQITGIRFRNYKSLLDLKKMITTLIATIQSWNP